MKELTPHGYCLLWDTTLISLQVISNLLVAVSYYVIPYLLFIFRHLLVDMVGRRVIMLFGVFILACGTTHVMSIITIWVPVYRAEIGVTLFTALVSMVTSVYVAIGLRHFIQQQLS